ncbi:hypothetical protein OSTOST_03158, partial [Ostertagia ostertagi]
WSVVAFAFAIFLAFIDWLILQLIVTIRRVPGCSSFGCFTNDIFREYWGLSNMMMNLLSCFLTVVIIYNLYKRSKVASEAIQIEKQNRSKIDKSANRVALYILLVSALIGVVPGCMNGVGTVVSIPVSCLDINLHIISFLSDWIKKIESSLRFCPSKDLVVRGEFIQMLDEISFFVGTCATLSGLSHAFIFAMAHREIRHYIRSKIFCQNDGNSSRFELNSIAVSLSHYKNSS